jgi:transcriptional regulator of arginine metabolism
MTDTRARARRQKAIAEIIRSGPVASQEEVTGRLAEQGFAVTQATVSRDLDQLGAIKVKRGGVLSYALPDQMGDSDWAGTRLRRILSDWVISTEAAGNIIVIKTPPGSAHLVGLAIDQARLEEVAGTISGDDTLFLAIRDGFTVPRVLQTFNALAGEADEVIA